jgi:hypothetical protein
MSRGRFDAERELYAIEARREARRNEIERSFADWLDELDRLEKAVANGETTRAAALRSWKRQYPGTRPMSLGEAQLELRRRLRQVETDYQQELEALEVRTRVEAAATGGGEPSTPAPTAPMRGRPRHRPPDSISKATVKRLMSELEQRRACRGDRKLIQERGLTQEGIARKLTLDRSRVQQAEALKRVGWDLLRSHPQFSANDEFVWWPSAKEAAQLLASGRAEN